MMNQPNIYALARARTQESIERVEKKRKRTKDTYSPEAYEEHKAQCREKGVYARLRREALRSAEADGSGIPGIVEII